MGWMEDGAIDRERVGWVVAAPPSPQSDSQRDKDRLSTPPR